MEKDSIIYLEHNLACIAKNETYTIGLSEDDFLANTLVQDAVIRNLEIIGEATKQISNSLKEKYPTIEWKKMAGMRDKLIHYYIGVDIWAVWGVVDTIFPSLKPAIITILQKEKRDR